MNMKLIVTLVTSIVVTGLNLPSSLAQAPEDDGMQPDRRGMGMTDGGIGKGGMMGMGMSSMDRDGDGMISRTEFRQAHEERFDSMDQDKDGFLTESEMESGRGMMGNGMMND